MTAVSGIYARASIQERENSMQSVEATHQAERESLAQQGLSIMLASDGRFAAGGPRPEFVYKDLGVRGATGGRYHAHVIRAERAGAAPLGRHVHTGIEFQLVYVLKGWVRFWYEGRGEILAEAGACVVQPPGIAHDVLEWSEGVEVLEITSPAEFATAPAAR
jgi:quercetin dioxygenase-like cupin family protein